MGRFIEFLMQVHSSFTAWAKYPKESMRIATKEGYYVSDYLGISEEGRIRLAAVPFQQTAVPAWSNIFTDPVTGKQYTREEFMQTVLNTIQELVDNGALEDDEELSEEDLSLTDAMVAANVIKNNPELMSEL